MNQPRVLNDDEYSKLSVAERFSYARQFPQEQFNRDAPRWHERDYEPYRERFNPETNR